MDFKKHLTGGVAAGTAVVASAIWVNAASVSPLHWTEASAIFAVAVFFGLFPDLDVSSIPQRWFFRTVFGALLYLAYQEQYQWATLLALVSITPLLDHHRSWTHHILSAPLFPLALTALYEWALSSRSFTYQFSVENVFDRLLSHQWLVIACIVGWYTHLLLDSRWLLFFRKR